MRGQAAQEHVVVTRPGRFTPGGGRREVQSSVWSLDAGVRVPGDRRVTRPGKRLPRPEARDPLWRSSRTAVIFSAVIPIMEPILAGLRADVQDMLWVAGFTACYLPGYLILVYRTVEGTRMRRGGWTLTIIAAAAIGSTLLADTNWATLSSLGVGVLLVLRTTPSLVIVAGLVAFRAAWSGLNDDGLGSAVWTGFSMVWGIAAVFSVVWLAGVIRRLGVARATLAANAVGQERVRTERELQRTLGEALSSIVVHAESASTQMRDGSADARGTLENIVGESRATLLDARQIISEFSRATVRSELDSARSLLAAAGMTSVVTGSVGGLDDMDEESRAALRSGVANLLAESWPRGSVVTITRRDGELILTATEPAGDGQ